MFNVVRLNYRVICHHQVLLETRLHHVHCPREDLVDGVGSEPGFGGFV
jgi:hypothetical protein